MSLYSKICTALGFASRPPHDARNWIQDPPWVVVCKPIDCQNYVYHCTCARRETAREVRNILRKQGHHARVVRPWIPTK